VWIGTAAQPGEYLRYALGVQFNFKNPVTFVLRGKGYREFSPRPMGDH